MNPKTKKVALLRSGATTTLAFRAVARNLPLLLLTQGVVVLALGIYGHVAETPRPPADLPGILAALPSVLLFAAIPLLGGALASALGFVAAAAIISGKAITMAETWRGALRAYWRVLGVFACIAIPTGILGWAAMRLYEDRALFPFPWGILGVLTGLLLVILLSLHWTLAVPDAIQERKGTPFGHLGRSSRMTKGHRGALAGFYVLAGGAVTLVALLLMLPFLPYTIVQPIVSSIMNIAFTLVITIGIAAAYRALAAVDEPS
ncbi:MAG: hypothetical protein WDA16_06730 [Candidatus Thermoplasmatota archaeon]